MKLPLNGCVITKRLFGFTVAILLLASTTVQACTIFVLTDNSRALFCNNEDWSDPRTVIWFVPGSDGRHGCVYVGFSDGWPQGGLNTEGLACDWVAGYKGTLAPDPERRSPRGNAMMRMLESCSSVDQAIAFYRSTNEPGFMSARVLVADRAGASVIIYAENGRLQFDRTNQCRGFGARGGTVTRMLAQDSVPTLANAASILHAALQEGPYATKYSNVYDLKSGDLFLYPMPTQNDVVRLNLNEELKKGAHFYELPEINKQLSESLRALTSEMERFL